MVESLKSKPSCIPVISSIVMGSPQPHRFFKSDHTKQDLMVRITADQNLSTSRHWYEQMPVLILENKKKLRLSSRHEANSEEELQDEVKAHSVQGPSPLSIFLDVSSHPIHL